MKLLNVIPSNPKPDLHLHSATVFTLNTRKVTIRGMGGTTVQRSKDNLTLITSAIHVQVTS